MPWYDQWGWASETEIPGRYTDVPLPENIPQGSAANWTGFEWRVVTYVAPVSNGGQNLITKRSFWNRFPATKEVVMRAVMLAGSPALLAGGLKRLEARVESSPYVDLDLAETQGGVAWLASTQVPEYIQLDGQTVPLRLTATEAAAVLSTVIQETEVYRI